LTEVYQSLGQADKALTTAVKLRDKHTKNFDALIALINTQLAAGKKQDAIDTIKLSLRYTVDFSVEQLLNIAKK